MSHAKKPRSLAESQVWGMNDGLEDRTATQRGRERQTYRVGAVDSRQQRDVWMTRSRKRKRTHKKKKFKLKLYLRI